MINSKDDILKENIKKYHGFPAAPSLPFIIGLSGQMYERKECRSNLAFIPKQYKNLLYSMENGIGGFIKYRDIIQLHGDNLRTIRKLLESIDNEHCLVFQYDDNKKLHETIGLMTLESVKNEFIMVIRITSHMKWYVEIHGYVLFEYENGNFHLPKNSFNIDDFKSKFKNKFPDFSDKQIEKLSYNIKEISSFGHGTSIVILNDKDYFTELNRLLTPETGHGIVLEKPISIFDVKNNRKFFSQLTCIDGGLLVNTNGNCHAVGCIFDGIVDNFIGDMGRGSRFNSVKLYVENRNTANTPCLGVVVSDDGSVDVIN